jgi:hypothetical protein
MASCRALLIICAARFVTPSSERGTALFQKAKYAEKLGTCHRAAVGNATHAATPGFTQLRNGADYVALDAE